jgi:hypothetical protein
MQLAHMCVPCGVHATATVWNGLTANIGQRAALELVLGVRTVAQASDVSESSSKIALCEPDGASFVLQLSPIAGRRLWRGMEKGRVKPVPEQLAGAAFQQKNRWLHGKHKKLLASDGRRVSRHRMGLEADAWPFGPPSG